METIRNNKQGAPLTINPTLVEAAWLSSIPTKTISRALCAHLEPQKVLDVLTYFFGRKVQSRGRQPVIDDNLRANLMKVAAAITTEGYKFGLLFCGPCGNGKTTMMQAIAETIKYLDRHERAFEIFRDDITGRLPEMALRIHNSGQLMAMAKAGKSLEDIGRVNMLGIDDLGKEPREIMNFGTVETPIVDLLEYRYEKMLFTVITTNLTLPEIAAKYGDRIMDRFYEMMHIIPFQDTAYRCMEAAAV